jgi:hypothetical protein
MFWFSKPRYFMQLAYCLNSVRDIFHNVLKCPLQSKSTLNELIISKLQVFVSNLLVMRLLLSQQLKKAEEIFFHKFQ